jgi:hypothetical protein
LDQEEQAGRSVQELIGMRGEVCALHEKAEKSCAHAQLFFNAGHGGLHLIATRLE